MNFKKWFLGFAMSPKLRRKWQKIGQKMKKIFEKKTWINWGEKIGKNKWLELKKKLKGKKMKKSFWKRYWDK